MNTSNIVHLIAADEIERIVLQLGRKYALLYSGQRLLDCVSTCIKLKQNLIKSLKK